MGRTTGVRRRIAFGLAAIGGALAVVLGGSWGEGEATARPVARDDVEQLVEQFSAGSSKAVVGRLEAAVAARPDDARALALLGLGYQQLARETADASWLPRSGEALGIALGRDPRDAVAVAALAQLAVTQHRFRARDSVGTRGSAPRSLEHVARGALGDALLATGRHTAAFRIYDRLGERARA